METHIERIRLKEKLSMSEIEHLSRCRFCQNQLADYIEQYEMIKAPGNLKRSVLEYSRRPEVQFIAGTNQLSRRLQLFFYTLKVSAAVLFVLSMLVMAPDLSKRLEIRSQEYSSTAIQNSDHQLDYYDKIDHLTEQLNKLSNSNREVYGYDEKER